MTAQEPRSASTVILVRAGENGGIEVFLTRRPDAMDFLGGAYVFPGGAVSKEDCSERMRKLSRGLSASAARDLLGAHFKPEVALGHWIAAVRELFEETGVLLCVTAGGESVNMAGGRTELERQRRKLVRRELSFQALLAAENLFCDASRLCYFSHWLTPEEFATRFDTRFFLAVLPPGQIPLERSEEVADSLWISPERAIQRYARGELPMIFPTYASLRTLADFESVDSVLAEYQRITL